MMDGLKTTFVRFREGNSSSKNQCDQVAQLPLFSATSSTASLGAFGNSSHERIKIRDIVSEKVGKST